jgi:hypothetical protein
MSPDEVAEAVAGAFAAGYRHSDCASVYGNQAAIGRSLRRLPRGEIWVTSKLWNDKHAAQDVIPGCKQSLADLTLDYLDTYLVHWPFPNYHPPGCDVTSRSPDARPYVHGEFMATWNEDGRAGGSAGIACPSLLLCCASSWARYQSSCTTPLTSTGPRRTHSYRLGATVPPATRLAGSSFAGPPRASSSMAALAISSAGTFT